MSEFLKAQLRSLKEYTPGEQPRDMQYIKLNTNESPFPPSEGVLKAVSDAEVAKLCLYPEPDCIELTKALAERYDVKPENIMVGNGSDEILNFCFMAYFEPEKALLFPNITYGFYKVFGDLYGLNYTEVPLKEDFSIDPADYIGKGANIVIANPNAPTGMEMPMSEIEKIISTNTDSIVIVDEAYVDFGGQSAASLTKKYKNLIVVMTFSKSRSLAGARVGFAIADEALIRDLKTIKYSTNPYNINRLTQVAALAAVKDADYYDDNCKTIAANREYLVAELEKLGFSILPSKANFIFAQSDKISGKELYLGLKSKGVLVRHFDKAPIDNFVRITIGTKEQLDVMLQKINELL